MIPAITDPNLTAHLHQICGFFLSSFLKNSKQDDIIPLDADAILMIKLMG